MLTNFRKALATAALLFAGPLAAHAETFRISNETKYAIDQVYVSHSGNRYWGADRLGSSVLFPDYSLTLDVNPGWYDVKLVDSDGDVCIVNGVDFRSGESWTLTNQILTLCELGTALR